MALTDTEIIRTLATKCMGWTWHDNSVWLNASEDGTPRGAWEESNQYRAGIHWNPLSSISDAFQVVEKMGGMWLGPASNGHGWIAAKLSLADYGDEDSPATKYAETAARAICLAAIAALEGK